MVIWTVYDDDELVLSNILNISGQWIVTDCMIKRYGKKTRHTPNAN